MRTERTETLNYQLWKHSEEFKNRTNLYNTVRQAIDFSNGKQYPNENYNNMIRITQNFITFAVLIKASKTNGTAVYLTFTSDSPTVDCTALRRLDEYTTMKMDLQTFGFDSCCNAYVTGTEVTFVRFSDSDMSYKGIYKGGMQNEHIDPRDFAVANPFLRYEDLQNQEWVEWARPMSVRSIINLLDETYSKKEREEIIETLYGEATDFTDMERIERNEINYSMLTVFQRFFRINGEVFIMLQTKYCSIYRNPRPLNRKLAKDVAKKVMEEYERKLDADKLGAEHNDKILDMEIDPEEAITTSVSDRILTEAEYENEKSKFYLYPFAVFEPYPQQDNFYGRSDVTGMISSQQGVNFAYSMLLKCLENNAYNKIFAKDDALGDQEITNEPGQVIIDYSGFTNGWGIKLAESQPLPNGVLDFADRLFAQTRVINSFNDVMDGSAATGGDLSGYAMNLMIKQANTSVEQIQRRYWRYHEEMAAIRLQYYRFYYDKAKYTYQMDENEYADNEEARQQLYNASMANQLTENENNPELYKEKTRRTIIAEFDSKDIYGANFDIAIDAIQGTNDSKVAEQQLWQNLFLNGGLQNIDPEILALYFRSAPDVSSRTKAAMENAIEYRKKTYTYQLEQRNQELTQTLEQVLANAQRLEGQNSSLQSYLKNLQNEFSSKITQQNRLLDAFMKDRESAQKSANATVRQEAEQ